MTKDDVRKLFMILDAVAMDPKVLRATDDLLVALKLDVKLKEAIVERMRIQPLWYLMHKAPVEQKLECLSLLMAHFLEREEYRSCALIHLVTRSVEQHDGTWRMLADAYGEDEDIISAEDKDKAA